MTSVDFASPSAQPTTTERTSRWALASLSLSMLLASLGASAAAVALPTLAQRFDATFGATQWIVIAYLLASTMTVVSVGRMGDLIGRRRLLLIGLGLFAAMSFLCGVAPSLPLLIAARAAQGVGAAIMMALSMALVGEAAPKEKTGAAMGLLGTMSAIGTALGPSLGGLLLSLFDWRAIFIIAAPLSLIALTIAWRHLPATRSAQVDARDRFDFVGALLLALTLGAYALAMTIGRNHVDAINMALLGVALIGAGFFAFLEPRIASPLITLDMLRDRRFGASLAMSALISTVMMATLIVSPFYLSRGLGLSDALAGVAMSAGPIMSSLSGAPAGRLVDRFGANNIMRIGLTGMIAGLAGLAASPASFGVAGFVTAMLIIAPGYQLFQAANNSAVMADATPAQRGVTSGLLNLARNIGLITGASVMGAIFAAASGASDASAATSDAIAFGMRVTLAIAAALIAVALAISAIAASSSPACVRRRR